MTFEAQQKDKQRERAGKLAVILQEIARQLAWRGPTGKMQGHVVLEREDAVELLGQLMYQAAGEE